MKPVITTLIIVMVLGQIILHGCRNASNNPFHLDTELGTCSFTGIRSELGHFRMDLDGTNPLQGAFLFQKRDHLACINSNGDLDLIALFEGNPLGGIMQVKFINAGKENAEISNISQMILPIHPDDLFHQVDETAVVWRDNQDDAFRLKVRGSDDLPWDLSFKTSDNQLILSLTLKGSPLVLLPGEELELPQFEISVDTSDAHH
jgi:hypothetical protein